MSGTNFHAPPSGVQYSLPICVAPRFRGRPLEEKTAERGNTALCLPAYFCPRVVLETSELYKSEKKAGILSVGR